MRRLHPYVATFLHSVFSNVSSNGLPEKRGSRLHPFVATGRNPAALLQRQKREKRQRRRRGEVNSLDLHSPGREWDAGRSDRKRVQSTVGETAADPDQLSDEEMHCQLYFVTLLNLNLKLPASHRNMIRDKVSSDIFQFSAQQQCDSSHSKSLQISYNAFQCTKVMPQATKCNKQTRVAISCIIMLIFASCQIPLLSFGCKEYMNVKRVHQCISCDMLLEGTGMEIGFFANTLEFCSK